MKYIEEQRIKISSNLQLSAKTKVIYATLAMAIKYANMYENYKVSIKTIASYTKECEKTIAKHINILEKLGYLEKIKFIVESNSDDIQRQYMYKLYSLPKKYEIKNCLKTKKEFSNKELYFYEEPTQNFDMISVSIIKDNELNLLDKSVVMLLEHNKTKNNGRAYIRPHKIKAMLHVGKYAYLKAMQRLKFKGYVKKFRDIEKKGLVFFFELETISKNSPLKAVEKYKKNRDKVTLLMLTFNSYIKHKKMIPSDNKERYLQLHSVLAEVLDSDHNKTFTVKGKEWSILHIINRIATNSTDSKLRQLAKVLSQKKSVSSAYILRYLMTSKLPKAIEVL